MRAVALLLGLLLSLIAGGASAQTVGGFTASQAQAQRAYDDTISRFWWGAGASGHLENLNQIAATAAISGVTNANPAVVTTASPHGYVSGQSVWISGVVGMTQANSGPFAITVLSPTSFSLGVDSTAWGAYASAGVASSISAPYPGQQQIIESDDLWQMSQSVQVLYSWWKAAGSADALARLTSHWNFVKNQWPLAQIQQCQTYTTAAAQDDAAWAATELVELYEATADPVAAQYAQGMLDCAWTRWQDSALGGGLWYDDTKTSKASYQAQYALASYMYFQDTGNATYQTRATQLEAWMTSALLRNGQSGTALNTDLVLIGLPYGNAIAAGQTVAETFTCSCIVGSPVTITYTETNTDTVQTIAAGLAALVNATTALTNAGISSLAPGANQTIQWPAADTLAIAVAVSPTSGGPTASSSVGGPAAGAWSYPTDGLLWIDTKPNNAQPYGVSNDTARPYSISEAGSVTMIEAQMAYADLEALLFNATGTAAYKTRLNQVATGMRTYETVAGTNVLLNDRDANVDGFAAFFYARDVLPLLTAPAGTQADKTTLETTAWTAATNDRCPDGTYGGSWEGPCQGIWFRGHQTTWSDNNVISSQAANVIIAGYYASLH